MEMEVLGILIVANVCKDPTRAVFGSHVCCNAPNDGKELAEKLVIAVRRKDIGDMRLRGNDDMHRPMWLSVMKCKDAICFHDLFNLHPSSKNLVAIKIFHSQSIHP